MVTAKSVKQVKAVNQEQKGTFLIYRQYGKEERLVIGGKDDIDYYIDKTLKNNVEDELLFEQISSHDTMAEAIAAAKSEHEKNNSYQLAYAGSVKSKDDFKQWFEKVVRRSIFEGRQKNRSNELRNYLCYDIARVTINAAFDYFDSKRDELDAFFRNEDGDFDNDDDISYANAGYYRILHGISDWIRG